MGKGDKKTRKGKIFKKTYGNSRPRAKKGSFYNLGPKKIRLINDNEESVSNLINRAVFPILSSDENGIYFIGTGFFINQNGWFMTAKHVAFEDDVPINPFIVIQILNEHQFQIRHVHTLWAHETADITVGKLMPMLNIANQRNLTNPALFIKKSMIKNKKGVFTYAYPESRIDAPDEENIQIGTFTPFYQNGKIKSITNRNDRFFKGVCIQSNMTVKGGASGGPVFNNNGYVIGLNTSGYDVQAGQEPISFTTPIQAAFEMTVPFANNGDIEELTIKELIERNIILSD